MRGSIWAAVFVSLSFVFQPYAAAGGKEASAVDGAGTSETKAENTPPELPPAVREIMEKELSKLPPAEQHFRRAQDYHARGKLDEAVKELELGLKSDPKDVACNCELGVIYMGKGDYGKAIEQLRKTLDLDPKYPKTHYALANAYARRPHPDVKLARKHLDESIKLGYHAVPWFLDYMKGLESRQGKPQTESPDAQISAETK